VNELKKAFKCIPQPKLDEMINAMILENGHDGAIDVAEFVALLTKPEYQGGSFTDMHVAFNDITDDLIKEHNRRNLVIFN
jgi:Ca2+-binding EF-hand superfamily protein